MKRFKVNDEVWFEGKQWLVYGAPLWLPRDGVWRYDIARQPRPDDPYRITREVGIPESELRPVSERAA